MASKTKLHNKTIESFDYFEHRKCFNLDKWIKMNRGCREIEWLIVLIYLGLRF